MKKLTEVNYAWLAALVDGEGSVLLQIEDTAKGERKFSVSVRPEIVISNSSQELIQEIFRLFGGKLEQNPRWNKDKTMQYKDAYTWRARGFEPVRALAKHLIPYLIIKRDKMIRLEALCRVHAALLEKPLLDPRPTRNQIVRRRLPNRGTIELLKWAEKNWFEDVYKGQPERRAHTALKRLLNGS